MEAFTKQINSLRAEGRGEPQSTVLPRQFLDLSGVENYLAPHRSFVFTDHLNCERLVNLRNIVEREVRKALNIPFNPCASALLRAFDGPGLPGFIHRIGEDASTVTPVEAAVPACAVAG